MVRRTGHSTHVCIVYHYGAFNAVAARASQANIRQVISSVIAAWSDISSALDDTTWATQEATAIGSLHVVQNALAHVNAGYVWMFCNCITSAAFVSGAANIRHHVLMGCRC